ncbi:hypothetical protein [Taklimakanibacter lacteus]|uniref:hypothetical protein n=1 Tax=Taklimakanibacter lacteus TaxID=2268456 RepID=UPI000E671550
MQIRLSQSRPPLRLPVYRGRFLVAFLLAAAMMATAHALLQLQPDSISAVAFLSLPLVLFGALGMGRELLSPSLTELAFYCFAVVAAGLIWPGARLAVSAYQGAGLVTLAAFMVVVFVLAMALGVLAVKFLASRDGET